MAKKVKISIVVGVVLVVSILIGTTIYYMSKIAPNYYEHEVKPEYETDEKNYEYWLTSYLDKHMVEDNRNIPIVSYKIDYMMHEIGLLSDKSEVRYLVDITVAADKEPTKLFRTPPTKDEGLYHYKIVLTLNIFDKVVAYSDDVTYDDYVKEYYSEDRKGPEPISPKEFYNGEYEYLEVRETVDSEWIKTPILSKSFVNQFARWSGEDPRIYFEGQTISIFHEIEQGYGISTSVDGGKTWNTYQLVENYPINNVINLYLEFHDGIGYAIQIVHEAMNTDMQTLHKTTNNGKTWTKGEQTRSHLRGYSILDNKHIFYTEDDKPTLFYTKDLGKNIDRITLPKPPTIEGPYKDSGLEWDVIFKQAYPPFEENGKYYMHLGVGDNNDFKQEIAIKYVSKDKGLTWKFDSFEDITVVEEEIN